jgi:hypothetical protein
MAPSGWSGRIRSAVCYAPLVLVLELVGLGDEVWG